MYMYLDRELKDMDMVDVQAHIDDCLPCLEAFEFESELRAVIASKCKEQMPAHLYERIQISIRTAHLIDPLDPANPDSQKKI